MQTSKHASLLERFRTKLSIFWFVFVGLSGFVALYIYAPHLLLGVGRLTYVRGMQTASAVSAPVYAQLVDHVAKPDKVRAIYMSQCVAGTPSFRNELVTFIDNSILNAVVVDIRDYTGRISFPTENSMLKDMVSGDCGARDMREFIKSMHEKNIYVIGRITTFQNPYYSKLHPELAVQKKGGGVWHDYKGLAFIDVGAKPYWDTVVELARESHDVMGFDELNFDYLRHPSDGPMDQTDYSWGAGKSKPDVLESFYKYLSDALRTRAATSSNPQIIAMESNPAWTAPILSADLFGMVATNYDDLNIGQVLERALPYFDYIDPMVYPSHYPKGFQGFADVNKHPYEIVRYSMGMSIERIKSSTTTIASFAFNPIASTSPQLYSKPSYDISKMRPWLQSFDYPVTYTPAMVKAQIKATEDSGLGEWIFWDATNKYTALRAVLSQ